MMMRVLILENSPTDLDNLERWVQEAAERKGVPVDITPVQKDHKEEFEGWLDEFFAEPDQTGFDLTILDIIFKAKGRVKQDFGGVELWRAIKRKKPVGYDVNLGKLLVVTNGVKVREAFEKIRCKPRIVAKGNREAVIKAIESML